MKLEKTNNKYNSMDNIEKFAMRYGALGRSIGDVVRDSSEKISNPNKIFDAWVKGEDIRKNGEAKDFLDGIEKAEMDEITKSSFKHNKNDANGISVDRIKDNSKNNLNKNATNTEIFQSKNPKTSYDIPQFRTSTRNKTSLPKSETLLYTGDKEKDSNNLLQIGKTGDIMKTGDITNYSNSESSANAKQDSPSNSENNKTYVTYGYPDVNVVGGIQSRLNEMGYEGADGNRIKITGTFDNDTEECIKEFQKDRNLPVTGIFDDATKTEMGFLEDYSVSRKGKNSTPWMPPESSPFNMEAYNKRQEELKREEEAKKAEKEKESSPLSFLANVIAGFLYNHGGAQPFSPEAEIIYDEYQKNIENDLNELSKRHGEQMIHNYMGG